MIIDGHAIADGSMVAADVCIVGAGPAGISLALRLAETTRHRVILLESGGFAFDPAVQDLARGETTGLPYYPLQETRIRMVGGSTQSWGGVCTQLDPLSLVDRAWVPGGGWPFPDGTLDPYFGGALERCGVMPEARETHVALHARRLAEWPLDASRIEPVLVHFSRPIRFGAHYRNALATSERIRVHVNSTVTELIAGDGGDGIAEVVVRCLGGPTYRVRASAYVLASGGVENARLLLASTRRHADGIGNSRGMVGRHFMEHPRIATRYRVRPGNTPLRRLLGGGAAGTLRFFRIRTSPEIQRREELLAWHANLYAGYVGQDSPAWPSVRRIAIATRPPWRESPYFQDGGGGRTRVTSADLGAVIRHPFAGLLGAAAAVAHPAPLRRWLEIVGSVEQIAVPTNRIELTADRDALGVPRVRTTWNVDAAEERTHRRSVAILLAELERVEPGIGAACVDEIDPWPAGIVGTWHHIGATRMSADPATGVVDADARVHGVDNLYIVGSSVFPASGSTSPTVTIVQLAHRLGDYLASRLARSGASHQEREPATTFR